MNRPRFFCNLTFTHLPTHVPFCLSGDWGARRTTFGEGERPEGLGRSGTEKGTDDRGSEKVFLGSEKIFLCYEDLRSTPLKETSTRREASLDQGWCDGSLFNVTLKL